MKSTSSEEVTKEHSSAPFILKITIIIVSGPSFRYFRTATITIIITRTRISIQIQSLYHRQILSMASSNWQQQKQPSSSDSNTIHRLIDWCFFVPIYVLTKQFRLFSWGRSTRVSSFQEQEPYFCPLSSLLEAYVIIQFCSLFPNTNYRAFINLILSPNK